MNRETMIKFILECVRAWLEKMNNAELRGVYKDTISKVIWN